MYCMSKNILLGFAGSLWSNSRFSCAVSQIVSSIIQKICSNYSFHFKFEVGHVHQHKFFLDQNHKLLNITATLWSDPEKIQDSTMNMTIETFEQIDEMKIYLKVMLPDKTRLTTLKF